MGPLQVPNVWLGFDAGSQRFYNVLSGYQFVLWGLFEVKSGREGGCYKFNRTGFEFKSIMTCLLYGLKDVIMLSLRDKLL